MMVTLVSLILVRIQLASLMMTHLPPAFLNGVSSSPAKAGCDPPPNSGPGMDDIRFLHLYANKLTAGMVFDAVVGDTIEVSIAI